jgi:hypothetical protein
LPAGVKETFLEKEKKMAKENSKKRESELRQRAEKILSVKPEAFQSLPSVDVRS